MGVNKAEGNTGEEKGESEEEGWRGKAHSQEIH